MVFLRGPRVLHTYDTSIRFSVTITGMLDSGIYGITRILWATAFNAVYGIRIYDFTAFERFSLIWSWITPLVFAL